MGCLVLCGFFLCFGGGAAAFAAPSVEEMAGQMLLVGFKGQSLRNAELSLEIFRPATWAG